jgi:hypothetical protein
MEMSNLISGDVAGPVRPAETRAGSAAPISQGVPAPDAPAGGRDTAGEVAMIERLRNSVDAASRSKLLIDRDEEAGRFIYRMLDPETGETMRQWPPERYLELVAYLRDQRGGLINERA